MRNFKSTLCFLFLAIFFAGMNAQTVRLKVMSFNLHAGKDATLQSIADFIKGENPDIVGFQEIEYKTERPDVGNGNRGKDMVTMLAHLTGMQGMFFPAIDVYQGKFGNAVLSKYPFEITEKYQLPYAPQTEKRVAGKVKVKLKSGHEFNFITTHLDMSTDANGMTQITKLNDLFTRSNQPTIMVGDFNKRPGTAQILKIDEAWERACKSLDTATTVDGAKFDYICFYPKGKWMVTEVKVLKPTDGRKPMSDHYPLVATLEWVK